MDHSSHTVGKVFFGSARRRKLWISAGMFQHDLDEWPHYCNYEHPRHGYRNLGRRPIEAIERHLGSVREKG